MIAKSLRDYRRSLIGWAIGLSAFMMMYLGVYSSIKQNPDLYGAQAMAKFPGALKDLMGGLQDFTSGAGYLQSVVYQLFVPFLFIACAMLARQPGHRPARGGRHAGAHRHPAHRPQAARPGPLRRARPRPARGGRRDAARHLGHGRGRRHRRPLRPDPRRPHRVLLLGLFFGTVTLAVGAATGRRALATAVVGGWALLGYVVVTIGKSVEAIAWLQWVSPFHYYAEGQPLYQGLPVGDYLVLAGATAVLALTAVLAFDRRDVGV